MTHFGLLSLSLIFCSLNQAASEVYYITITSTDLCTVQPCRTLSQFAANSSHYLHSNTTLVFLPGTHYLSTVNLTLSNVDNFVMKSENSTAQIKCTSNSHIHFSQSQYIHITNLEFIGCGGNQVKHVEEFVVQDTTLKGQENSGTALELIETTAQIVNSTFVSNRKGSYRNFVVCLYDACFWDGFFGGAIIATNSIINISQSNFEYNGAELDMSNAMPFGGVLYSDSSNIIIVESQFQHNSATYGGVLCSSGSTITIEASEFHNNSATCGGVYVLLSYSSNITINASKFHNNSATREGGVLDSYSSNIIINASEFHNNNAAGGGVLASYSSNIIINASEFHNNSATYEGGVLHSSSSTITIVGTSIFTKNASPIGAVIYSLVGSKIQHHNYVLIDNNWADRYAVIYLSDSDFIGHGSENVTFSNNNGSLVAFNSNITFMGYARFENNQPPQTITGDFQEGGAITLFQSNIFFDGSCNLEHNLAENGGAILSTESKLYVNGNVTIAHNTATRNGGGVYLSTSELNCQQKSTFVLFNNTAVHKGGGLHATGSSIKATSAISWLQYTGTRINFTNNAAERGGGLSLEANAKLYVLKYDAIDDYYYIDTNVNTTIFTANKADYGGAVYVDDDTNSGTCVSDPKTECFFQVLAIHSAESNRLKTQSIYFSQNYATMSGSTLYGGLLDRCAVSQFAEVHSKYTAYDYKDRDGGIAYFRNVSTPTYYSSTQSREVLVDTNLSISSDPVRVCLCINDEHDCTHQSHLKVKKGETFTVSLVAVDQIGQLVNATIQTSLNFTGSGLAEGQLARKISAECTDLTFNVVSPHNSENLTLYASDGPCKDADLSNKKIEIRFLPCSCPIGFQISGNKLYM